MGLLIFKREKLFVWFVEHGDKGDAIFARATSLKEARKGLDPKSPAQTMPPTSVYKAPKGMTEESWDQLTNIINDLTIEHEKKFPDSKPLMYGNGLARIKGR
jgi:hypothetical protein